MKNSLSPPLSLRRDPAPVKTGGGDPSPLRPTCHSEHSALPPTCHSERSAAESRNLVAGFRPSMSRHSHPSFPRRACPCEDGGENPSLPSRHSFARLFSNESNPRLVQLFSSTKSFLFDYQIESSPRLNSPIRIAFVIQKRIFVPHVQCTTPSSNAILSIKTNRLEKNAHP